MYTIVKKIMTCFVSFVFLFIIFSGCNEVDVPEVPSRTALEGLWKMAGQYDAGDDETEVLRLVVVGSSISIISEIYKGNSTLVSDMMTMFQVKGTFQLVGDLPDGSATKIDITIGAITVNCVHTDSVTWANTNTFMGYSDWVINVPKDACGRTIDGEVQPCPGDKYYNIVKVDGDKLYSADEVTTESLRPTALILTEYYVKQ